MAARKKTVAKKTAPKRVRKNATIARKTDQLGRVLTKDGKIDKRYVNRVGAKSRGTGSPPSPRLKKRRMKNTHEGYYPNPMKGHGYVAVVHNKEMNVTGYYTGAGFDDDVRNAAVYRSADIAKEVAADMGAVPKGWQRGYKRFTCAELAEKKSH